MPYSSPFADVSIPETDLLSYLFPANQAPSRKQLWYDAAEPSQSLSPKQLLVWVKRVASGLERRGLGTGDVVLICTPNSLMVPAAYLGILGASCIFSAVNPTSTASGKPQSDINSYETSNLKPFVEITHQLRDTGAQLVLAHPEALAKTLAAASAVGLPTTSIFQFSDDGECPVTDGIKDWSELLATIDEVNNYTWKRLSPEESRSTAAAINYSSGTTGLPKGVCISHYNIIANVEQNISIQYTRKPYTFEDRPEERWIGFLPLYHAFGQLYTIVMSIRYNAAVYIMRRFNFINFIEALAKYRVTTLHCVPPILVMLNKRPETAAYDLKSIREVIVGAAPLSKETQNAIAAKFDCVVCQGWGMTELTASGLACPGGVHDDSGSVGQLYPNSRCKLVDESGNEVPLGQPGELMIHGPQVCMGYWKNAEATADNITPEGWLKTGDIAICNDNGYFWIVDRKKVSLA